MHQETRHRTDPERYDNRFAYATSILLGATLALQSCVSPPPLPPTPRPESKDADPRAQPARTSSTLTQQQIRDVVMAHLRVLRGCYEPEAKRDASLHGQITVKWQIAASGSVTDTRILNSTMGNAKVEGCIVQEVGRWTFPRSDASSNVEWPFRFGPATESDAGTK